MLKVDLHDFFHSIDETQVFRVFTRLEYQPLVSFEMARLCTRAAKPEFPNLAKYQPVHSSRDYDVIPEYASWRLGFLPQGSPSSGALANLVSIPLDVELELLAEASGLKYTRYADDMVFSTQEEFSRSASLSLLRDVTDAVNSKGFEIHQKKTKIVPPGARKIVLGLLVDGDKVRLQRSTRRRIDEHLRGAQKFGCRNHADQRRFQDVLGFIRHLTGLLNFAHDVDEFWALERRQAWEVLLADQGFRPSALYWI